MKKILIAVALFSPMFAMAGSWDYQYLQGNRQYSAPTVDGKMRLYLTCDSYEETPPSFNVTDRNGGLLASSQPAPGLKPVTLTVDGVSYTNPFTKAAYASETAYKEFWTHLRNAKSIYVTINNIPVAVTTTGIGASLPEIGSNKFSCSLKY